MDTVKLAVQERKEMGNGPSRRLRASGRIPGVVYGKDSAATPVTIAFDDFKNVMAHGHNVVLELDLDAKARVARKGGKGKAAALYAVVKELQFHPVKRSLLHVDLHEVDLTVEIEASVPIELVGTAAGLIDGGILDWSYREVNVRALPNAVPQAIEIDVSGLLIGHHLTVEALGAPEGVVVVDDPETVVVALVPPQAEEVVEPEEGELLEEPAEPEVIGETAEEE